MASRLYRQFLRREMPQAAALEKVRKTLEERSVEINGVRLYQEGTRFPKGFADDAETFLNEVGKRHGLEDGSGLFLADAGDKTGALAVMSKDGRALLEIVKPDQIADVAKRRVDDEVSRAASWGRSVEKDGTVSAYLKWAGNGFEIERSNMSPEESRKFLEDQEEKARIDAFVEKRADVDNIHRDILTGDWFRTGSWGRTTTVVPLVTWTAGEKSVVWKEASEK